MTADVLEAEAPQARLARSPNWEWLLPVVVFVVAFAVRWQSLQHSGGLHALLGYDEGVYFGASTSFVSGLMPYRDFVLVHPPGSVVLLSPFALLGRLTADSTGWAAARIFIIALGALNATLVFAIGRRVSLVAALVAGGLYAMWAPAVHVERTTMLEAFVLTGIVVALWALRTPRESVWRLILAGGLLGIGASTKLWGLVPLVVIVAWLMLSRAWRSVLLVPTAAFVVFGAVIVPFAIMAPDRMFDLVIRAQIDRGRGGTHEMDRLARMFNLDISSIASNPRLMGTVGIAALIMLVSAMAAVCWRAPAARVWVALLSVQLIVLVSVPVYFEGYSSFIAPALMLVVGTAVGLVWSAVGRWLGRPASAPRLLIAGAVVVVAMGTGYRSLHPMIDLRPHLAAMTQRTGRAQCVGSDSAGLLILTDTLTRNIERGCATVLDFDGTVYSFNDGANPEHLSSTKRRRESAPYQKAMRDYFATNDVLLVHRAKADVFGTAVRAELLARPLLYRRTGLRVFGQ